jgi:hypothetical protein
MMGKNHSSLWATDINLSLLGKLVLEGLADWVSAARLGALARRG